MALFNRSFVILWQGQLVSQLGSQAFLIAIAFHTLEATGSAALVAGAMMAMTIPLAVLSPIGGAVADRHSRRSILVITDLLRAIAVGGLGLMILWTPGASAHHVPAIIAVAAFGGVMEALFFPAVQALVPDLVPAHRLTAANSVSQVSRQVATLTGQALGGVLYVTWGAAALLLADAASFAYGAAATWCLPRDGRSRPGRAGLRSVIRGYTTETRDGMRFVWRRPGMATVLLVFAGVNFLFMPVFVLLPFYTRQVLERGPEWYGFLLGAVGAGALAGSLAASVTVAKATPATVVRLAVAGIAMSVMLLAAATSAWLALASLATIGVLSSIINVVVITAFQTGVPPDVRGRVMALVVAVSTATVPIGMGLGGALGEVWGDALAAIFAACGGAIGLLAVASWKLKGFTELLEGATVGRPVRAQSR